jgi:hypothetical protein
MPLNESTRKTRERWPLDFDLTGVPRDTATRKQLLQQQILEATSEDESMSPVTPTRTVQNSFTVDTPTVEITDINNPPHRNYNPHAPENEFPKMLYHHESGRVLNVVNEKEQKAALKRGYDLKPSPDHDYSKVNRAGVAAKAVSEPKREDEMSAEELAALDESDEEA